MKIKLDPGAYMPERAHATDGGLDLRSPMATVVPARGSAVIDTGVHVELPLGTAGLLVSKSGLNVRHDITSEGLIDAGYSGSIVVKLYNNGDTPYYIDRGGQDQPAGGHPGVPAQAGDRDRDGGDRAQVNIGDQVSQKSNYLSKLIINIKN